MGEVSLDVRKFLGHRRDRVVGSILGYAEAEVKPKLSPAEWSSLRRVVLDATNSYHDTVLDLVKSEDAVRNDQVIALLTRMDRNLAAQRDAAVATSDRLHAEEKERIVANTQRFAEAYEGAD